MIDRKTILLASIPGDLHCETVEKKGGKYQKKENIFWHRGRKTVKEQEESTWKKKMFFQRRRNTKKENKE